MHDDGDTARPCGRFDRVLVRAAVGQGALELAEDGFEHGQAGADDAEEGFERGQEQDAAVGVLRVQVCGVADGGGHLDAVDCDGTDPTAMKVSASFAWKPPGAGRFEEAYMMPIPNMQLKATFLLVAICNPHKTGIGKTTTTTSCSRFRIAIDMSSIF